MSSSTKEPSNPPCPDQKLKSQTLNREMIHSYTSGIANTDTQIAPKIPESVKTALINSLHRTTGETRILDPQKFTNRSSAPSRPVLGPGKAARRGVRGLVGIVGHWQHIGDAAIMNSCLKIFKVSYTWLYDLT